MRALSGKQANLLYLMTHAALRDDGTDPCDAVLSTLRAAKPMSDPTRINKQMRPLRGIGRQLMRFARELHRMRPWPENLKWPERRLAVFMLRMAKYYGQNGSPSGDLTPDERTALHLFQCVLGYRTLTERREIGSRMARQPLF